MSDNWGDKGFHGEVCLPFQGLEEKQSIRSCCAPWESELWHSRSISEAVARLFKFCRRKIHLGMAAHASARQHCSVVASTAAQQHAWRVFKQRPGHKLFQARKYCFTKRTAIRIKAAGLAKVNLQSFNRHEKHNLPVLLQAKCQLRWGLAQPSAELPGNMFPRLHTQVPWTGSLWVGQNNDWKNWLNPDTVWSGLIRKQIFGGKQLLIHKNIYL